MRWTIQQLLAKRNTGIDVTTEVDVRDLKQKHREIRHISPVRVRIHGEIGSDIASFFLDISGRMILPCARTLADVTFDFQIDAIDRFRLDGYPIDDDDPDMHEPEHGIVDLLPYVKEHILLNIPMKVVAEDGANLVPKTGNGWSFGEEGTKKEHIDPRLAQLKHFFDTKERKREE